ncbi:hypothetical protein [Nostoc sp.]
MKSKLGFHDYWQERSQAKLKITFTAGKIPECRITLAALVGFTR